MVTVRSVMFLFRCSAPDCSCEFVGSIDIHALLIFNETHNPKQPSLTDRIVVAAGWAVIGAYPFCPSHFTAIRNNPGAAPNPHDVLLAVGREAQLRRIEVRP